MLLAFALLHQHKSIKRTAALRLNPTLNGRLFRRRAAVLLHSEATKGSPRVTYSFSSLSISLLKAAVSSS